MWRNQFSRLMRVLIEIILLVMICASPWLFGAIDPSFEFLLDAGVALLMLLWAIRIFADGKLTWSKCPVAIGIAILFLLGLWQITPLPRGLLQFLSPATIRWYEQLIP